MFGSALKYLYWACVISPLSRLLLFLLGVWSIDVSYAESQKLRIRCSRPLLLICSTCVDRSSVSIRDIRSHDIVISNCVGYVQVLLYAALFRFASLST